MGSWNDFQRKAEPASPTATDFDHLAAVVFGGGAGADLLRALHEKHVNEPLPGEPSKSALAANNAKRQFVRDIERATARGLEALRKQQEGT